MLIYVDDLLIASKSILEIEKLKVQPKSEFEMKDIKEAKMILCMEIKRDRLKGTTFISKIIIAKGVE